MAGEEGGEKGSRKVKEKKEMRNNKRRSTYPVRRKS